MPLSQTQKNIVSLLADGRFHSGTELAHSLGITRAGVWKHLQSLDELDLAYVAVSGKGYRLQHPLELLDKTVILQHIVPEQRSKISSLEIYDRIPSTNTHLLQNGSRNAPSGAVCLAEQQTHGKGRRGRQWISPFGKNIYLSVFWRFQTSPSALGGLSLAAGVAVMRALQREFGEAFQLKWPNDIYYDGKKLGGILVEVSGESDGPCIAVIGLGLNISLSQTEAAPITQAWTDLSSVLGPDRVSRNRLTAALIDCLLKILSDYEWSGIGPYLEEWRSYDFLKDKPGTLYIGEKGYSGIVKGIDDSGMLLMEHDDGNLRAYASGEVSFNKG